MTARGQIQNFGYTVVVEVDPIHVSANPRSSFFSLLTKSPCTGPGHCCCCQRRRYLVKSKGQRMQGRRRSRFNDVSVSTECNSHPGLYRPSHPFTQPPCSHSYVQSIKSHSIQHVFNQDCGPGVYRRSQLPTASCHPTAISACLKGTNSMYGCQLPSSMAHTLHSLIFIMAM